MTRDTFKAKGKCGVRGTPIISIVIKGGVVCDVIGLPGGWEYEVQDLDIDSQGDDGPDPRVDSADYVQTGEDWLQNIDGEKIDWTRDLLEGLKESVKKHADEGNPEDSINFCGRELHAGYAKYMIEYLERKIQEKEDRT